MNKRTMRVEARAFSLLEVLIALGLAAIVMGVTLSAISHDTVAVAQASNRYQSAVWAGQALELKMEQLGGSTNTTISDVGAASQWAKFPANVTREDVIADPRVERVRVQVNQGSSDSQGTSAFRLKIRRQAGTNSTTAANSTSASNGTRTATGNTTGSTN